MSGYALTQPYSEQRGFQSVVPGVNPAAGANLVLTLDSRWVWRLISCVFTLTTDATVANRYVTVEYQQDAQVPYCINAAAVVFTANGTQRYAGAINQTVAEWNTGTDVLFRLAPLYLFGGNTVTIRNLNAGAADTLTLIRFVFERFPTDQFNIPVEQL